MEHKQENQINKQVNFGERSISNHLLMVRPYNFCCNQQTLQDNMYQSPSKNQDQEINKKAISQFDEIVAKLRTNNIKVTVVQDPGENKTPDSIFPNNFISFHYKNKAILYPMCAPNRRFERKLPVIQTLKKEIGEVIEILHDYTQYENSHHFLQGTGSLVLDRQSKIAYACLSQRTNKKLVQKFCMDMNYKECSFTASQYCQQKKLRIPIYHTNVLMSVSKNFVMICLQLIHGQQEQLNVKNTILQSRKQIIELTPDQILHFAGNTLTVQNLSGQHFLIMSQKAYKSLKQSQIQKIEKHIKIITANLQTIEQNGGGSARCMIAQVF